LVLNATRIKWICSTGFIFVNDFCAGCGIKPCYRHLCSWISRDAHSHKSLPRESRRGRSFVRSRSAGNCLYTTHTLLGARRICLSHVTVFTSKLTFPFDSNADESSIGELQNSIQNITIRYL
jgi:hypothetical protein